MAIDVEIIPATRFHASMLAPNMRDEDKAEVWATGHYTPLAALEASLDASEVAWSGFADGNLVVMFGAGSVPSAPGLGVPWLLGSDLVLRYHVSFLRRCCDFRNEMLKKYAILTNWVDARNSVSIRWLRWMGARFEPAAPFGADGLPFHQFVIARDSHV